MDAKLTVLLAEDEADDVFLMRRTVARLKAPLRMEVVNDGEEVLNYLRGAGGYADRNAYPMPSLILLDLKMPKKSGLEVLEWLKEQPEFAEIDVVMLTSSQVSADIERARSLGAKAYLVKAVQSEELRRLFLETEAFLAETHWAETAIPAGY